MLVDICLCTHAAVHENVALATVTMHVTEEDHLIIPVVSCDQFLRVIYGRVEVTRRVWPAAVQISARKVTSVVSNYNPVRV